MAGERLLARAQQGAFVHVCARAPSPDGSPDFQTVGKIDPANRELQSLLRRGNMVRRSSRFAV